MSTEVLTKFEILALLEEAFPSNIDTWECMYVGPDRSGFWCTIVEGQIECEEFNAGWVLTQKKASNGGLAVVRQGVGPTIPAAIADFRTRVVAEAVALGAVYLTGSMPVQTDEPCDEFDGQPCVCYAREKCCPHTERRRKERAVEVTLPKPAPSREYNYLEAAIFAAFFQYAYTNSHTPSEAIDAANNAVEEYRAAIK